MSKLNACCNKALNSVMNKDKILQKYSTHNVNHTIQFTKYINEHKYLMYNQNKNQKNRIQPRNGKDDKICKQEL